MLVETAREPGFITLVYPFCIFGYALLKEYRAGKRFWNFIMVFTQVRLLIEFILVQDFWDKILSNGLTNFKVWCWSHYIGIKF